MRTRTQYAVAASSLQKHAINLVSKSERERLWKKTRPRYIYTQTTVRIGRLRRALRAPALERVVPDGERGPSRGYSRVDTARTALSPALPPLTASDAPFGCGPTPHLALKVSELDPRHCAALLFQARWRASRARRALARAAQRRVIKVCDAQSGLYYFVDARTSATSWEPPRALWDTTSATTTRAPRSGMDTVAAKRLLMAQAAAHLLTPRAHAEKYGQFEGGEWARDDDHLYLSSATDQNTTDDQSRAPSPRLSEDNSTLGACDELS